MEFYTSRSCVTFPHHFLPPANASPRSSRWCTTGACAPAARRQHLTRAPRGGRGGGDSVGWNACRTAPAWLVRGVFSPSFFPLLTLFSDPPDNSQPVRALDAFRAALCLHRDAEEQDEARPRGREREWARGGGRAGVGTRAWGRWRGGAAIGAVGGVGVGRDGEALRHAPPSFRFFSGAGRVPPT